MENTSYTPVRIENAKFGRRGLLATGCAFFGAFALLCLIGATAPEVISEHASAWAPITFVPFNDAAEQPSTWLGQFTGLSTLNQFMWLDCQARRDLADGTAKLKFDVSITLHLVGAKDGKEDTIVDAKSISRTIECDQGAKKCNTFAVFALETVLYSEYRVQLDFKSKPDSLDAPQTLELQLTLNTLNASWTKFDLCWKYFFLATTLFVLLVPYQGFGYIWELRRIDPRSWTSQQKWILGLLCGLVLYNDPFYAAEVYTSSSVALASLYLFFSCTFVCALLHFWLCVLDDMRLEVSDSSSDLVGSSGRRTFAQAIRLHFPKLVVVLVIWILLLAVYSYVRVQRNYDMTYDGVGDNVLVGGQIVLIIAMCIYVIWMLYLLVVGFSAARNLSPPFKLIFTLTVFTILCAIVALFGGFLYPIPSLGINYLLFYALFSLYVWTLAYSYSPMKDEEMYTAGVTMDDTSIELHMHSAHLGQTYTIEDEEDGDYDERDVRYDDEANDMIAGEDDGEEVIV